MLYRIRPRRELDTKMRNAIYRAINNGSLPEDHHKYPAIPVGDDIDLEIFLHEVSETCRRINEARRMYGTTKAK